MKSVHHLKLNESMRLESPCYGPNDEFLDYEIFYVTRVPGGWIYAAHREEVTESGSVSVSVSTTFVKMNENGKL